VYGRGESGLPAFWFITLHTRFPKGAGLPGRVCNRGVAQLAQNLETSSGFICSLGKDPAVITSAVGLPIASQRGLPASILLLLRAQEAPRAGMTQLWDCESTVVDDATVATLTRHESIGGGSGVDRSAWQETVMERINRDGQPLLLAADELPLPSGATFCLSLPVYRQADLCSVLNMMF